MPDWQEKGLKVDSWRGWLRMAKFVFIGARGGSSSARDSFDGWSPALSVLPFFPPRGRKIIVSPGMKAKSRTALVSQHVQPDRRDLRK